MWKKSSFCESSGCVEVAWRKSSYSASAGNCLEVADVGATVLVRDSKLGDASPVLSFTRDEWAAFVDQVKSGVGLPS